MKLEGFEKRIKRCAPTNPPLKKKVQLSLVDMKSVIEDYCYPREVVTSQFLRTLWEDVLNDDDIVVKKIQTTPTTEQGGLNHALNNITVKVTLEFWITINKIREHIPISTLLRSMTYAGLKKRGLL